MVSEQSIVEFTESVAAEIAEKYASSPGDELRAWVRIAHQRESMVTKLYEMSGIERRLGEDEGAGAIVREVISSIWAHEESHTRFLGTLRSLSDSLSGFAELQGRMEGVITRGAASGNPFARMLIAMGTAVGAAPAFANDLRRMNLRELVRFHGELETTARMGYRRILDLQQLQEREADPIREYGYTFSFDVAKILCEERFHEDAFQAMARWVAPDGESFTPMPKQECAEILRDLCVRNLSVSVVRGTLSPRGLIPKGGDLDPSCASDGGLGNLFASQGLGVSVLTGDALLEQLRG